MRYSKQNKLKVTLIAIFFLLSAGCAYNREPTKQTIETPKWKVLKMKNSQGSVYTYKSCIVEYYADSLSIITRAFGKWEGGSMMHSSAIFINERHLLRQMHGYHYLKSTYHNDGIFSLGWETAPMVKKGYDIFDIKCREYVKFLPPHIKDKFHGYYGRKKQ